jgi:lipoprotein-anchoring transpeptidase ErfK/SrfK
MHRKLIFASIAAAAVACATTPKSTPASAPASTAAAPVVAPPAVIPAAALADHEGDSPETAVTVPSNAPNEGIDFQNNWIYDRYGRFRRAGGGIAHAGEGSALRRYEVVKIELADHSERTVFFDITENEKTWTNTPAPPQPH